MKKLILVFLMVFGMAISVNAGEAKAETKKANVFGSKAKKWLVKGF